MLNQPIAVGVTTYHNYPDNYFLLARSLGQQQYHLCLNNCNVSSCTTPVYNSNRIDYNYDTCIPEVNIYTLEQYKILSFILSYCDENMNVNQEKLQDDFDWRILINMLIDGKMLLVNVDCMKNFITEHVLPNSTKPVDSGARLLPVTTLSRSRQYIDVPLGNIYNTFNLSYNNFAIDEFVNLLTQDYNHRVTYHICIVRIIDNIINKLTKNAFVKINAISNAYTTNNITGDVYNAFIENENKIYTITNKLLWYNFTPNISSMLVSYDCSAGVINAYSNLKVDHTTLNVYFTEKIKEENNLWSLSSYKIFVLELLKSSRSFLETMQDLVRDTNNNKDILCMLIQIAYTLECFYRIGLIHNDLHPVNILIEKLTTPIDFFYIITSSKGIHKVINIKTQYFVRIFDFDRSYTFSTGNRIPFQVEQIVNPQIIPTKAPDSYDFTYICIWLLKMITPTQFLREVINTIIDVTNVDPKEHPYDQIKYVKNIRPQYKWLLELDKLVTKYNLQDIIITNDLNNATIKPTSHIYILPDAETSKITNQLTNNISWNKLTVEQKVKVCNSLISNEDCKTIVNKLNKCKTVPMNLNPNVTIDWVRHAESCANFDSNNFMDIDTYAQRPLGYDNYTPNKQHLTTISWWNTITTTKLKSSWNYEPNLSYIGMQQAIKLRTNYLKGKSYDIVVCSCSTRTIMTALLACRHNFNATIFVVPYISEIQNIVSYIGKDYQNTGVSSSVLKQRIAFIKDWLEYNWINNFDDIEIMEDLAAIKKFIKSHFNTDPLISQIDELLNNKPRKGIVTNFDTSKYVPVSVIDIIKGVIKLFEGAVHEDPFVAKYIPILENCRRFIRGPPVNFSILEYFEKEYQKRHNDLMKSQYDTHNNNIFFFYTQVIQQLNKIVIKNNNDTLSILCFSHGSLIRYIWKTKNPKTYEKLAEELKHMRNTTVITENLNANTFTIVYTPPLIRTTYQNFESLNIDVCRTESIKGILNFDLADTALTSTLKTYVVAPVVAVEKRTEDVKFFNKDRYQRLSGELVVGDS